MAANTPPDAGGAGEARREVRLEDRRTLEKWAFIGVCPHDLVAALSAGRGRQTWKD